MGDLVWFRRDLRLGDNPAVQAAGPGFHAVFLLDPVLLAQGAATRWRVARGVAALAADLRAEGGRLICVDGDPQAALPALARALGAARVHVNRWPEAARRDSDRATFRALEKAGVALVGHDGHTLLPAGAVRKADGGDYAVYSAFARAFRRAQPDLTPAGAAPRPAPQAPEIEGETALEPVLSRLESGMNRGAAVLAAHALAAGEQAARDRLAAFLDDAVARYPEDRDRPDRDGCSALSEALAVGEISPRRLWTEASAASARDPVKSRGAGKFLSELLWREFAWTLLAARPDLPQAPFRAEWADFGWRDDPAPLRRWQQATTGEPLVDAGLREMFVTGRMHNRVRMAVASYLTKHLLVDWRHGLAWFGDCLTDWCPAANAMNWQWVAGCGPDAAPYFRIFNPALQAEKFDPRGTYRRRWLTAPAYFDAIPRGWDIPRAHAAIRPMLTLAEGRARALAAYQGFRG